MPASKQWVKEATDVLLDYMPGMMPGDSAESAFEFVSKLRDIPTRNQSLQVTLRALQAEINTRRRKPRTPNTGKRAL